LAGRGVDVEPGLALHRIAIWYEGAEQRSVRRAVGVVHEVTSEPVPLS
jgi:hypothetical protein